MAKNLFHAVFLLALVVVIAGCQSPESPKPVVEKNPVTGCWVSTADLGEYHGLYIWEFAPDGRVFLLNYKVHWKPGDKIVRKYTGDWKLDGDSLYWRSRDFRRKYKVKFDKVGRLILVDKNGKKWQQIQVVMKENTPYLPYSLL